VKEKAAAIIIEPVHDLIPNANERLVEEALNARIPVIYLNSSCAPSGVITIAPDYREAGKNLTDKLKGEGRRKTACIFCTDTSSGMDEYKGYIDSVSSFDESRCLLLSYKEEKEILEGNLNLLNTFINDVLPECDSVFCENGMIAHSLTGLLKKRGVSVPETMTVACFDNGYYSEDSIVSMGYDNDSLCRKIAKTAVALAEDGIAKDIVIALN
jgi:LacI family transcriptional regulator